MSDPADEATSGPPPRSDRPADTAIDLPVIEEDIRIGREEVSTGALRVRVEQREGTVEIDLESTLYSADVQRVAVGREVDEMRPPYQDGSVLVVPVYEETIVLQRRWVLKEELRIHRTAEQRRWTEPVVVRRDHALIERRDADGTWSAAEPARRPEPDR
ncbi:MAG TPA: DUF2382 domain-containing protein [Burkholderiaceae bacterium]|jgi:stress response protein YsnF|nr:DUF2382 domain-containing protein [Burkholderiaceae bacterium]